MADIADLLNELRADGTLYRIAMDPRAQFGTQTRRLIGAELLPERLVDQNAYTEEQIRFRTVVANAGTRYSPAQRKGGALVGSFQVMLAESDIASEFSSRDYDTIVRLLQGIGSIMGNLTGAAPGITAAAMMVNFMETTVRDALVELLEVWRWQAMVDGVVKLRGDNEYSEDVAYPRYPDLHGAALHNWSDGTQDPFADLFARTLAMSNRGMTPGRLIMGRSAFNLFAGNLQVRARVGKAIIGAGGTLQGTIGRASLAEVNGQLEQDGLPPIELYDLQYRTTLGSQFFLRRDVAVLVAQTGRNETIDLGDGQFETVENTLGYTGVGRPAGAGNPGRTLYMESKLDKPPRVDCQGWQTALPVITEPEAVSTITGIA